MSKKEYVLDSLYEDIPDEDYNENWSEHKEQVRDLLKKGLYGFIGGALIFGFLQFAIHSMSNESDSLALGEMWSVILISLGIGITCTGFPFGWNLLNRLIGHWSIWGNIFIVVALFVFKLTFALLIGIFTYPVALVYHLVQSQKNNSKVKRAWLVIALALIAINTILFICFSLQDNATQPNVISPSTSPTYSSIATDNAAEVHQSESSTSTTPTGKCHVTAEDLPTDIIQQVARDLVSEKQKENDEDPSFTYSDVELYGIFFLEGKENPWADKNQLHFVIHYTLLEDNGDIRYAYYIPMYIKDIQFDSDGTITLERKDLISPFFYETAEDYLEKYKEDYNIIRVG